MNTIVSPRAQITTAPPAVTPLSHSSPAHNGQEIQAGVVLFDNDGTSETGWACLAGGRPFRVRSAFTLPSDVVWWSNAPYRSTANRLPRHVRHADYLKVPIGRAMAELGQIGERPEDAVGVVAGILSNTLRMLALVSPSDPDVGLSEPYLYHELEAITANAPLIPDAILRKISASAWEPWTQITNDRPEDTLTFRQPRLSYALSLLDSDVPAEDVAWKHPPAGDPLDHIRRTLAPCFAEFSIDRAMPGPSRLFGLGASGRRGGNVQKTLASHPELLALSNFADLKVRGVWSGNSYRKLHEFVPGTILDFLHSPDAQFSWSLSVIADSVVRAIMAPRTAPGRGRRAMTWRGFWLRGADKVNMFALAMQVQRAGYLPASYGYGWLRVRRPDNASSMAGLLSTALRLGLIPEQGAILPAIVDEVMSGKFGPGSTAPSGGWGAATFAAHIALHNCSRAALLGDDLPLLTGPARDRRRAEIRRAAVGRD